MTVSRLSRCSCCGALNFIGPDPTTCGPCVVDGMAKIRRLLKKTRGLHSCQQRQLAGPGGPLRVSEYSARSGDLRHAGSVGPQASPGAEGASSVSRAAGVGSSAGSRPNDASTPDVSTVTLIDGRPR